ncbi:MAG: ATP-binding protein [Telluria sp.]
MNEPNMTPEGASPHPDTMFGARRRAERELSAAQDALRAANARVESMLESLTDAICAVDREWRITYLNGRALEMLAPLGMTRESVLTRPLWDEFPDLASAPFGVACHTAMRDNQTASAEMYYPRLACWIGVRAYPSPEGVTIYVQDITQHKADQQALIDGNARLQLALSAGGLGDWRWDAASDHVTLGPRAAVMFGVPAETPLDWTALQERLDESSREQVRRAFMHAFATQAQVDLECRLVAEDGPRWIALAGRANYAGPEGNDVAGMIGVVQDITARKNAEESLRQSEEVLRALANSIPQLAFMARDDGAIDWFNERWYEYTGIPPDQATGWGWERVLDPEVLHAVQEHWQHCVRTGEPFEMEYPIRGADGRYRWFLTRINAVRDLHGRVVRWFGTNTDVDEVKRAEQALREESHVLELLNSTGAALASTRDLRTLLATASDAAAGIAGARFAAFFYHGPAGAGRLFTLYTMAGATSAEFQSFAEPQAMALFGPSLLAAGPVRSPDVTHEAKSAVGTYFGLTVGHPAVRSYLAVPVVARSGEILGTMFFGHPEPGVFTERTERIVAGIASQAAIAIDNSRLYEAAQQAAEERKVLLEREREARAEAERTSQMKDEFLATLSHELRTPLSAILGWAQVLRRGGRDGGDLSRGLETIERNARAQAQLIEDLLDMSRITSGKVLLDMQVLNPASFIDAAIDTVRPGADAKSITLEKRFAPDPGLIAGDPARLQQVIWNLLSNAIKFTPRDGHVTVTLARREGHIAITVADSGIGIKPEFITHVFERFRQADASTTRRHGGLGLGLSIVKHLVEQHGGTVRVESAGEGKGASFTIELPLAKAAAARPRGGRGAQPLPTPATQELAVRDLSGVDVLVVDDDRDARELMTRILTDCQATVRTAASAREGFDAFQAARPNILISDLGMPDNDGFELLAWVRALGREHGGNVPAIALTAFARSEDRLRALEAGFSAHISKPVEASELIAAVAGIVGPASPLLVGGRTARSQPG